jgi:hypothetical protein
LDIDRAWGNYQREYQKFSEQESELFEIEEA